MDRRDAVLLTGLRLRGLPPVPGLSTFLEVNARTYVTYEGKPGIWFFTLDAESRFAVEAARLVYRLPYHHARMSAARRGEWIDYRSSRVGARLDVAYRPVGPVAEAEPGTLEHFLDRALLPLHRARRRAARRADPPRGRGRSRRPRPRCARTHWRRSRSRASRCSTTRSGRTSSSGRSSGLLGGFDEAGAMASGRAGRRDAASSVAAVSLRIRPLPASLPRDPQRTPRPWPTPPDPPSLYRVSPQRRTALVSVFAAAVLVVLKLVTGLATGSLGLVSEALHSGTDLVAALLTFFAVGVAVRPADRHHEYGHGKAEHLAALAEASILALLSGIVAIAAIRRLGSEPDIDVTWWALLVVGVVIAVDASRMVLSLRVARRHGSPALEASALHFGSDLAGSLAVLAGLLLARAGYPAADALRRALRLGARAPRRDAADPRQRRRADGPRARRGRGGRTGGDRAARAGDRAAPAAHARGIWPPVRGRRHRRARGRGGRAGARRRRRRRDRGAAKRSRTATSSSTSSPATRPRCATARTPPRSRSPACARCTTSTCSTSARSSGSRSTSSSPASCRSTTRTSSRSRSSGRSARPCPRRVRCRRTSSR